MVWEPKECCCGASLRTGTLVLGWLGVIFSSLHVLSQLRYAFFSYSDLFLFCQNRIQAKQLSMDAEFCANFLRGFTVSGVVFGGIVLLTCILLLIGVNKNKPNMMLPYLITKGIGITLLVILSVLILIPLAFKGEIIGVFIILVVFGGILSLMTYLFQVVRACHKEVKQHSLAMGSNSDIAYVEQKGEVYNYKM